ncbi:FAD/NAD(P)-binding protein [uncultured Paracoccus sp.]|uniref:FAD/NAD(P)-binding protein n=1 Tax=uncultured Paracoccus sp. TaxID=189685 RepID=UPI0025F7B49C|nr:FAD/NAD(P)-binding protein [uncultured Paracoccus sp.]
MTQTLRMTPARPASTAPHVVIIGGGASGVLMATHLLSRPGAPLRVTLVEGKNMLGCGIAYSTDDPQHLLNTRVHNMSAFPGDPDHFRRWLESHHAMAGDRAATAAAFVSRPTYGAYLADLLSPWQSGPQAGRLSCIRQTCLRIGGAGKSHLAVHLDDGRRLLADQVILATGHVLPAPDPAGVLSGAWEPPGDLDPGGRVIIIGTGLSMVDQVLSLLNRGHRGEILALSRRGLIPRRHAAATPMQVLADQVPLGAPASRLFRWARGLARQATLQGGTWRDAVDGIRPHVRRIWAALPLAERARFLRHALPWWDIHRHRMPPQSADRIADALASGQVRLIRGRFAGADQAAGGGLVARIAQPGGVSRQVSACRIIDCRGILRDPLHHASPLVADLIASGRARIDPMGIGLDVSPDCAVIDAAGAASARLHAIGPASRAAFWEITAIPDIREQTTALAQRIADLVAVP